MIAIIEPSPHDAGDRLRRRHLLQDRTTPRPYLYKTNDYGATWTKITGGIPADDFTRTIREDPARRGLLYCGTETGIYVSFDDGGNWQRLETNLPDRADLGPGRQGDRPRRRHAWPLLLDSGRHHAAASDARQPRERGGAPLQAARHRPLPLLLALQRPQVARLPQLQDDRPRDGRVQADRGGERREDGAVRRRREEPAGGRHHPLLPARRSPPARSSCSILDADGNEIRSFTAKQRAAAAPRPSRTRRPRRRPRSSRRPARKK